MRTVEPHDEVPTANAEAVERKYGDLAREYAAVRADAAEAAGNPDSADWEQVEDELGRGDRVAER